jgi:hypothetical protein
MDEPIYTHTPGPWRIYEGGQIGSASVRRFPAMTVLNSGTVKGETIGVAIANARLIAAAPDLLAHLIALVDYIDGERQPGGTLAYITDGSPDAALFAGCQDAITQATHQEEQP